MGWMLFVALGVGGVDLNVSLMLILFVMHSLMITGIGK